MRDRQTNGRTDRRIDQQTDGWTDLPADGLTHRSAYCQPTDRPTKFVSKFGCSVGQSVKYTEVTHTSRSLFGFVMGKKRSKAMPEVIIRTRPTDRQNFETNLVGRSVSWFVRPSVGQSCGCDMNVTLPLRFCHGEEAQQSHTGGRHSYSTDQPNFETTSVSPSQTCK
jgi:hypothetical protein